MYQEHNKDCCCCCWISNNLSPSKSQSSNLQGEKRTVLELLWKKDVPQILPQVTRRLRLHLNCRRRFSKAAVTHPHRRLTPASLWDRFLIGWAFTTDSTTTSATVVFGLPVSEHVMTFLACLGEKNKQTSFTRHPCGVQKFSRYACVPSRVKVTLFCHLLRV